MRRALLLVPFLIVFAPAPAYAWGNCNTHPHDCGRTTTTTAPSTTTTVAPTTTTLAPTTTTADATTTTHPVTSSSRVPSQTTPCIAPNSDRTACDALPFTGPANVALLWGGGAVACFVGALLLVSARKRES